MVRRFISLILIPSQIALCHALIAALIAKHINTIFLLIGVFMLDMVFLSRSLSSGIILSCKFYRLLAHGFNALVTLPSWFLVAALLIGGAIKDDPEMYGIAGVVAYAWVHLFMGATFVSCMANWGIEFVTGRPTPSMPTRKDVVIATGASFNDLEMKSLEESYRRRKKR